MSSVIQKVLFNLKYWMITEADEWLERKGLKSDNFDMNDDFYIYRQVSQETLRKKGYTEYSKKILNNHVQCIIASKSNSEINSNVR
jgi:hypothetical protein